jgi:hypothetical protein
VDDFRMELQAPDLSTLVGGGCDYVSGLSQYPEAFREFLNTVSMAHPALKPFGQTLEKRIGLEYIDHGFAELTAIPAGNNLPAQRLTDQLKPIADPQHRQSGAEQFRRNGRTSLPAHRIGAPR